MRIRITGGDIDAPRSVRGAFWVWVAAGVVGLLEALLLLAAKNALVDQAIKNNHDAAVTADQIRSGANNLVVFELVTAVLFASLYVYFAYRARDGIRSGRTALVVVGLLHLLLSFILPVSLYVLVAVVLTIVGGLMLYIPVGSRAYFNPER